MRFGTRLYGVDPDAVVAKAVHAEELGFDSLWRGDHLILPAQLSSRYPHSASGRPPIEAGSPILDVLTLYAYLAAETTRIKLATGIYLLALRDPLAVARSVQTLDIVSGGRVILGVAAGWLEDEFELAGRDFSTRGPATDEAIALLKALWTEDEPAVDGRPARFEPKPVQKPHPPIFGGGESIPALRRAARLCDGWYGHRPSPGEVATTITELRRLRDEAGRADLPFELTVRIEPERVTHDDVARYEEAGVDRLVAEIGRFDDVAALEDLETMTRFAEVVGLV